MAHVLDHLSTGVKPNDIFEDLSDVRIHGAVFDRCFDRNSLTIKRQRMTVDSNPRVWNKLIDQEGRVQINVCPWP